MSALAKLLSRNQRRAFCSLLIVVICLCLHRANVNTAVSQRCPLAAQQTSSKFPNFTSKHVYDEFRSEGSFRADDSTRLSDRRPIKISVPHNILTRTNETPWRGGDTSSPVRAKAPVFLSLRTLFCTWLT